MAARPHNQFGSISRRQALRLTGLYGLAALAGRQVLAHDDLESEPLTCYRILSQNWKAIPILRPEGGMSAEFAVAKAAETLCCGVATGWIPSAPGQGPVPVAARQHTLEQSIATTVELYDRLLGGDQPVDSAVVGTGVFSAPYICRVLKAPFLPLHFLVTIERIEELAAFLASNRSQGLSCSAVAGYDVSLKPACAWVKLLSPPPAYLDFLRRHQVRKLAILGCEGVGAGETAAIKLVREKNRDFTSIAAGDIYVLHTQGGSEFDKRQLRQRLPDMARFDWTLQGHISDWESGLSPEQVAGSRRSAAQCPSIMLLAHIGASGSRPLYDLATCLSLRFVVRNSGQEAGNPIRSLVMNPYLICHPQFESRIGALAYLYWQAGPAERIVGRMVQFLSPLLANSDHADAPITSLPVAVHITRNFGGFQAQGCETLWPPPASGISRWEIRLSMTFGRLKRTSKE